MKYYVSKENKHLKGEVALPASKSISNRALIIQALCDEKFRIKNLSDSEDTKGLVEILNSEKNFFNVGNAGTNMRFLTSYFGNKEGEWTLTGSDRMKNRPIGILVNALKEMGVRIDYLEKEGFPPIRIYGTKLNGGEVDVIGNISSQFISSLLLIAPTLPEGIILKIKSNIVSKPYIEMTLKLMEEFGVVSCWEGNAITIRKQAYKGRDYSVEADWSSASYWYEMAVFAEKVDLKIIGLKKNSLQGDAIVAKLFEPLGIKTTYLPDGVRLTKKKTISTESFDFNFINNPDLAQTLTVTLALINIPFKLTGLGTLIIKETNRINALRNELLKFGINLVVTNDGICKFNNSNLFERKCKTFEVSTYNDHRMAMAFAPISLISDIIILNPNVVGKSYPSYWDDLRKVGFKVQEICN